MSKLLKSKFLLGVMIVAVMVVGFAVASKASAATCDLGTVTLRQGSTGDAVKCLQTTLGITADGKFGPMTKASVMAFQSDHALTADGVVGAKTKAALAGTVATTTELCPNGMTLASNCTTAPTVTPTQALCPNGMTLASNCTTAPTTGTTGLTGSIGSVDTWSKGSADVSTLREGDTNKEVFVVEAEVANDGDVKVEKADVYFGLDAATGNTKPWNYFKNVSLTVDGVIVATQDADSASDWTEITAADPGNVNQTTDTIAEYRMRFSGLSAILKNNTTAKIGVLASALATIDSADQDGTWLVAVTTSSFKVVDGSGFATNDGAALQTDITFGSTKEAVVKVYDSTSNLDAHVVEIDTAEDTNGVELYKFTIEETNNVKIDRIQEIAMTFVSTTENDEAVTFRRAYLYDGSTLLGAESVPTGGVVTFDNLDFSVNADSKKDITVKVDLNDVTAGVDEGTTISVGSIDLTKFEDANGNDEGDITETVTGDGSETLELRSQGIQVKFVSSSIAKTVTCSGGCASGEEEQAQATIVFDVTAFGANAYLVNGVDEDGTYTAGSGLTTTTTGAGTSVGSYSVTGNSTTGSPTHTLIVNGTTARVTLVVNVTKTTPAGFVKVALTGVEWNQTDDTTTPVNYTLDLGDYKTSEMYLDFAA